MTNQKWKISKNWPTVISWVTLVSFLSGAVGFVIMMFIKFGGLSGFATMMIASGIIQLLMESLKDG